MDLFNSLYIILLLAFAYYHKDYLLKVYEATSPQKMLIIVFVIGWYYYGHYITGPLDSVSTIIGKTSSGFEFVFGIFDGIKNGTNYVAAGGWHFVDIAKNGTNYVAEGSWYLGAIVKNGTMDGFSYMANFFY